MTSWDLHQRARVLREAVIVHGDEKSLDELTKVEAELLDAEKGPTDGVIVQTKKNDKLLGPGDHDLDLTVDLRLAQVPTALAHLLTVDRQPLVQFSIRNHKNLTKRLRLTSFVEGYSAKAVETVQAKFEEPVSVCQLPTFFPSALMTVTELTRATVNVKVEDLDQKTELHRTKPIWLLARTTAPLRVKDPSSDRWVDVTPYLGAFVTPNHPSLMSFLRQAAELAPGKRLVGYQIGEDAIPPQVKAIYDALRKSGVTYVNSLIDFSMDPATFAQRVRRPSEAIHDRVANCLDGVLLFASLLEAISLHPAIVLVPGHAFLAWERWTGNDQWSYVETTMIGSHEFAEACERGEKLAAQYQGALAQNPDMFTRHSLRALRTAGITPME